MKYYKPFKSESAKNYIGSTVAVHDIAKRVWAAFDKVLFGNGNKVHYKKPGDINSLAGYQHHEILYKGTHIEWNNLKLPLKLSPNNRYEEAMLDPEKHRIKNVRIFRKPGKTKYHWYAQLVLEGLPEEKANRRTPPTATVGLDIGPQTLAYSSKNEVGLLELADKVQPIANKKRLIQRKMDRSRRATNPNNYNEDGTIKRGIKLTHHKSKNYLRLQRELAYLQHCQAETRKRQHTELANHLLTLGDKFYVEHMSWASLAHRSRKTEISEKTGKFKSKKRYGKSIANKAPAMLISILENKCKSLAKRQEKEYINTQPNISSELKSYSLSSVEKVSTMLRASQYNHLTKEYTKKDLDDRWNYMPDGKEIQRDIYSAFLLQHCDPSSESFNQELLERDYPKFVEMHDPVIDRLSKMPKTLSSMGIKQRIRKNKQLCH